eukprot:1157608-Pelagomonas_calceolata.AAC.2
MRGHAPHPLVQLPHECVLTRSASKGAAQFCILAHMQQQQQQQQHGGALAGETAMALLTARSCDDQVCSLTYAFNVSLRATLACELMVCVGGGQFRWVQLIRLCRRAP